MSANDMNFVAIGDKVENEGKEMNDILQPCPFCGGEVYAAKDQHNKVLIVCENCNLHFGIVVEDGIELVEGWRATFPDLKTAVETWNRRS